MMVALQTHPFAIELQFDDESLTGAVHPAEKSARKDLPTPLIRSELWDFSIQFFRNLVL